MHDHPSHVPPGADPIFQLYKAAHSLALLCLLLCLTRVPPNPSQLNQSFACFPTRPNAPPVVTNRRAYEGNGKSPVQDLAPPVFTAFLLRSVAHLVGHVAPEGPDPYPCE